MRKDMEDKGKGRPGHHQEDLIGKAKAAPPPEPEAKGRWMRVDSRTVVFVKEGQDADEVAERYRNRSDDFYVTYDDLL